MNIEIVRSPSYRDLTLAMEHIACALRAMSDGHAAGSRMVIEPLTWAASGLREIVTLPPVEKVGELVS